MRNNKKVLIWNYVLAASGFIFFLLTIAIFIVVSLLIYNDSLQNFILENGRRIYFWCFLGGIFFLFLFITIIIFKNNLIKSIEENNIEEIGSKYKTTMIDAFPFASLVFFLVSLFLVFDFGKDISRFQNEIDLLSKLGLGLVSALVTAIVVLYGTHLTLFERNLTDIFKNLSIIKIDLNNLSKTIENSSEGVSKLGTSYGFSLLASMLRREIEGEVITKAQKDPNISVINDPFLNSTSNYITSAIDSVIFSDNTRLNPSQASVSRSMISKYLEEEAFDYAHRRLITNSRNYTSFLIGAARRFEDEILKTNKKRQNNFINKVIYLTHTLVAPTHLFNWPWPSVKNNGLDCRATPFMVDYMTYCKYFAKSDNFIHGRAIRFAEKTSFETALEHFYENPFPPPKIILDHLEDFCLASWCDPYGVPLWSNLVIDDKPQGYFNYFNGVVDINTYGLERENVDFFKDIVSAFNKARIDSITRSGNIVSLHWPLFVKKLDPYLTKKPKLRDVKNKIKEVTNSNYFLANIVNPKFSNKEKEVIIKTVCDEFEKHINKAFRVNENDPDDLIKKSDYLLKAIEEIKAIQWTIDPSKLLKWDEIHTAILLLVNYYLGLSYCIKVNSPELCKFDAWFTDNFHSNSELSWYYPDSAHDFNEEFALIGIICFNDECMTSKEYSRSKHIQNCLGQVIEGHSSNICGCHIKELLCIRSSMYYPWKHAEIEWYWKLNDTIMPKLLEDRIRAYIQTIENNFHKIN